VPNVFIEINSSNLDIQKSEAHGSKRLAKIRAQRLAKFREERFSKKRSRTTCKNQFLNGFQKWGLKRVAKIRSQTTSK
jgi:hypothetical protein